MSPTPRRIAASLFLAAGLHAFAGGEPEGIALGNQLYDAGKFKEAAARYALLLEARAGSGEESAQSAFNRGDALYRMGDFAGARDSFEQAAVKTRRLDLEARATYNMGNCSYRQAEAAVAQGGLQQAVQALEESIAAYRRSLEIQPGGAAAVNLEVARALLKGVRDEMAKYGDIQDLQREIVETLKKLVARQDALIQTGTDQETTTAAFRDGQVALRGDTHALLGRFDELLQRLARIQGSRQNAGPYGEARRHVESSESHQGRAVGILDTGDRTGAASPQLGSLAELKKALELLTPPEREDKSQQGQSQSDTGQGGDRPPSDQGDRQGTDQPQPSEQEQKPGEQSAGDSSAGASGAGMGALEKAEDILQEEGDKRRVRDAAAQTGSQPVDKDW